MKASSRRSPFASGFCEKVEGGCPKNLMPSHDGDYDFDYIVVGSGFGGRVTAPRLTEKGCRVAVMEMGRRWTPENLPRTNWNLRRWFWRPSLGLRGFFNIQWF